MSSEYGHYAELPLVVLIEEEVNTHVVKYPTLGRQPTELFFFFPTDDRPVPL